MKPNIVIIAGDFHQELANQMIAFAQDEIAENGGQTYKTIVVAGSYEVPLIADLALTSKKVDAVVALGYIEKGETLHGEVMGHVVHKSLVELQVKHKKPIGLGIIGPGATMQQAEARKEGAAKSAVKAVFRNLEALNSLE